MVYRPAFGKAWVILHMENFPSFAPACSVEQLLRHIAAVFGDARKNRLVQPHIHLRRISHQFRWAAQFGRQLLSRGETAVHIEKFKQVDD